MLHPSGSRTPWRTATRSRDPRGSHGLRWSGGLRTATACLAAFRCTCSLPGSSARVGKRVKRKLDPEDEVKTSSARRRRRSAVSPREPREWLLVLVREKRAVRHVGRVARGGERNGLGGAPGAVNVAPHLAGKRPPGHAFHQVVRRTGEHDGSS